MKLNMSPWWKSLLWRNAAEWPTASCGSCQDPLLIIDDTAFSYTTGVHGHIMWLAPHDLCAEQS